MHESTPRVIGAYQARTAVIETVVTAAIMAVGAGLISSSIFPDIRYSPLLVGGIIVALGIAYLSSRINSLSRFSIYLEPLIVFSKNDSIPIPIESYEFSEKTAQYIQAATKESSGLRRMWENNDPFYDANYIITEKGKLATEAVEYYVMNILSIHLENYIKRENIQGFLTEQFDREALPGVILQNRFADLFSRPMNERDGFHSKNKENPLGKIVAAYGPEGHYYSSFDITLPKGSKFERESRGCFKICSKYFSMKILCRLTEFNTITAPRFEELYLKRRFTEVDVRKCKIEIDFYVPVHKLFVQNQKHHYLWVDSFIQRLCHSADFSLFLKEIQWTQVLCLSRVMSRSAVSQVGDNSKSAQKPTSIVISKSANSEQSE